MSNNYTVYMHISPSGKRYIGITSMKPKYRWNNGKAYKRNIHFTNAIEKYGWDNFQHIIIVKGLTKEEARWLEIELIREFDLTNKDKGYNISKGGDIPSDETRKKLSESRQGKNNSNAETVVCITTNKIFDTMKEGAEFYGIKSFVHIGMCCRKERYSCGTLKNGKPLVWRYYEDYLKMTEEEIQQAQKEAEKKGKAVINLTTMEIFDTVKEGAEFYGIADSGVTRCCKGNAKSCGKLEDGTPLVWVHYKDFLNMTEEEIQDKLRKADKRVICVTTEKIFDNMGEGARYYNTYSTGICRCCKQELNYCGKLEDGTPLIWRYYVDYLEQQNNNNKSSLIS